MKIVFKTNKPEEMEATMKILKEDIKKDEEKYAEAFGKLKINIDISWEKQDKDIFVFNMKYTGENFVQNWKMKKTMWTLFKTIDSEIKEL